MKHLIYTFSSLFTRDDINVPTTNLEPSRVTAGLNVFFGIAAAVAVLFITISALKIVISRGNSQDVTKARDAIIYSAIGLAITMSAFVIVNFVVDGV